MTVLPRGGSGISTGGSLSGGTSGKLVRWTGATSAGVSKISDDGTRITVPNFSMPETDLGVLGAGPLDLDLSSYDTCVFKFTCALGGTTIRSIKRQTVLDEEVISLRNMSNNVAPGEYLCILTQDDPGGTYGHLHLECRQPWQVIPPLGHLELRRDLSQGKWFASNPLAFGNQPRKIPMLFSLGAGVQNDIAPVDSVTGVDAKYGNIWRVVPDAGTILTGILSSITAGSDASREVDMINYGSQCIIAHANSNGGASTYSLRCPGSADMTWRTFQRIRAWYDASNTIWIVS